MSNQIAELLKVTYTSSNNTQREEAESQLKEHSRDISGFFQSLLGLITDPSSDNLQKNAAATRLRQFTRECVEGSVFSSEDRTAVSEQLYRAVTSENLERNVRVVVAYSLNPIISEDSMGVTSSTLANLAREGLGGSKATIQGSLLVIKNIFACMSPQFSVGDYFRGVMPDIIQMGKRAWSALGEPEILEILEDWSGAIKQILEHFEITSSRALKEFVDYHEMAVLLGEILNYKVQDPLLQEPSTIAVSENYSLLNTVKTNLLASLNIILQHMIDNKKKTLEEQGTVPKVINMIGADLPDSPYATAVGTILEPFINSVILIASISSHSELYSKPFVSELVIESYSLLTKACGENRFYALFAKHARSLEVTVCLNSLKVTQQDFETLESSPEEFVNVTMDVCERQESRTLKTTAAQLLESICDNIDGSLAYEFYFVVELLDQVFSQNTNLDTYPHLSEWVGNNILQSSDEQKVDVSLVVLSILSYSVSKRPDLLKLLEKLLKNYVDLISSSASSLIHNRFCLVLYFYLEYIFPDDRETFGRWIFYLINCLDPSRVHRVALIQACESFTYLVQDDEIMFRMEPFVTEVIGYVLQVLPRQNDKYFFEAVQELVQRYTSEITQHIPLIINSVTQKIQSAVQNPSQEGSLVLAKCWNIIKTITDSSEVNTYLQDFEKLLTPLFSFLQNPNTINFEDDIVMVILNLIRKTQTISEVQWQVFDVLKNLQDKQKGCLGILFRLVNLYVVYGREQLQDNPARLGLLVEMAEKALYAKPKQVYKESCNSDGAVLLQLLLYNFPGFMDNFLEKILSDTLIRYTQGVDNGFLKVRLLGVVEAAFTNNVVLTMQILSRSTNSQGVSFLRYALLEIIQNSYLVVHSYDKRVAVYGLCELIAQQDLPGDVSEILNSVFEATILILSCKTDSAQEGKNKTKIDALIDELIENESDEEMLDSEIMVKGTRMGYGKDQVFSGRNEETESNITLSQLKSPIVEMDEYEHFRKVMNNSLQTTPQVTSALVEGLSQERKQQLVEILKSKRISFENVPGENSTVRRIVKPKSRQ